MIKPLGDRVVVEPSIQREKTESGIILPDTAQESVIVKQLKQVI